MSKSEHTPGPWEKGIDGVYAANNLKICTPLLSATHAIKGNYYTATIEQSEREANARLIAAAPDLLEALESALAQLQQTRVALYAAPEWDRRISEIKELERAEDECRAAIVKARA